MPGLGPDVYGCRHVNILLVACRHCLAKKEWLRVLIHFSFWIDYDLSAKLWHMLGESTAGLHMLCNSGQCWCPVILCWLIHLSSDVALAHAG